MLPGYEADERSSLGHEPDRRPWREEGGRSECRGRCATLLFAARRTPGTANGAAEPTPNHFTQAHIDFASKAFIDYQQKYVGDIYFAEDVKIGSKEWVTLIEEIFAYITGDIHSGDPRGEVHAFLRDYDAVKEAWDNWKRMEQRQQCG